MPKEWWPEEKEEKMAKKESWDDKDRFFKLASVLYPMHTSEETRRQMAELAAREGKRSPQQARQDLLKGKK